MINVKKINRIISMTLCMGLVLANTSNVVAASKPTVTKKMTINVGQSKTIKVKGKYIKSKTFKSNKKSIATVSKKGKVTGKKVGKAKITVTVKYKKSKNAKKVTTKKYTCTVTVNVRKPPVPTNKPVITKKPNVTQKPSVTENPKATPEPPKNSSGPQNTEAPNVTDRPQNTPDVPVTTETPSNTEKPDTTVTLLKKNGITIKTDTDRLKYSSDINLEVKNNSGKDIIMRITDLSIDDEMADCYYRQTIKDGKKSTESLKIYNSNFYEGSKIEFTVEVMNKNYHTLFTKTVKFTVPKDEEE